MSKMGNWVLLMQEEAAEMTRTEFAEIHGTANLSLWDQVNGYGYDEEDYPAMEEGFHGS